MEVAPQKLSVSGRMDIGYVLDIVTDGQPRNSQFEEDNLSVFLIKTLMFLPS